MQISDGEEPILKESEASWEPNQRGLRSIMRFAGITSKAALTRVHGFGIYKQLRESCRAAATKTLLRKFRDAPAKDINQAEAMYAYHDIGTIR